MNRSDLRTETRRLIKDTSTDTNRQRWSDTDLNSRIKLAQEDLVSRTSCLVSRGAAINIVADTTEYDLPTGFLHAIYVAYKDIDGDYIKLEPITLEELELYNGDWENTTSSEPTHYYLRLGSGKIGLYPTPTVAVTSGLRIDFVKKPTAFSNDTTEALDAASHLSPFHEYLCYYVAHLCKLDEGNLMEANIFQMKYLEGIRDTRARIAEQFETGVPRMMNIYEIARMRGHRVTGYSTNPFRRT